MDHEKPEVMVAPSIHTSNQTIVQPDIELVDYDEHLSDGVARVVPVKSKRERRGDSLW
jgi:hypothetical protein